MMRIAICDDSKNDMAIIVDSLIKYQETRKSITFWLRTFVDGTELLDLIREGRKFDVFIIDVVMPEINGINLVRSIRQYDEAVRVIFMSGSPEYADVAASVCADGYLQKPVSEMELFAIMDETLASIRLM